MRKTIFVLAVCYSVYARAADKKVKAEVEQVTVYLSSAMVKSQIKSDIEPGTTRLIVQHIPTSVDQRSLQISGKGDFTILGIKFEDNNHKKPRKSHQLETLEDSLHKIIFMRDSIVQVNEILKKEEELIDVNRQVGGQQTGVKALEVEDMGELYRERALPNRIKVLKNKQTLLALNDMISPLQLTVNEQNSQIKSSLGEIIITLSSNVSTNVRLELSYVTSAAGWSPVYDIRAKDINNPIQLVYKANVWQHTGQNWENVKLRLSTGNPAISGNKPVLNNWYLSIPAPILPKQIQSGRKSMDVLGAAPAEHSTNQSLQEEDTKEAFAVSDFTNISQTAFSVGYDISVPYTIPSNRNVQMVEIRAIFVPALYRNAIVPKLDPDAFLVANITEWGNLNLLAGEANVYFEGNYVGKTILDPTITGDTLEISLGRDKNVAVKRDQIREYTSRKVLGNYKKADFGYEISIKNNHKEPISVNIEDQVPVSQDSQIEIQDVEANGGEWNKETGKVTWKMALQPAESKKVQLRFTVKYPKDKNVSGL